MDSSVSSLQKKHCAVSARVPGGAHDPSQDHKAFVSARAISALMATPGCANL
jgi:hypothetical protein